MSIVVLRNVLKLCVLFILDFFYHFFAVNIYYFLSFFFYPPHVFRKHIHISIAIYGLCSRECVQQLRSGSKIHIDIIMSTDNLASHGVFIYFVP